MRVRVDVISDEAIRRLNDTGERAVYLRPVLVAGSTVLNQGLIRNFRSQGRDIGTPWPRKADGSRATLVKTGALQAQVANLSRQTKTMGIAGMKGDRAFIARFHQGGTSRGLPARPIMGYSSATRYGLIAMVERYLVDGKQP